MDNSTYWSDGKSSDDIEMIAATDSYTCVIYNLHEDTLCMREEIEQLTEQLAKANERVKELECSVDKANEMLEEVRASGDLGLYMDNKLTAFLVGDSEQLRKEQE